jgi:hypothetical protein
VVVVSAFAVIDVVLVVFAAEEEVDVEATDLAVVGELQLNLTL